VIISLFLQLFFKQIDLLSVSLSRLTVRRHGRFQLSLHHSFFIFKFRQLVCFKNLKLLSFPLYFCLELLFLLLDNLTQISVFLSKLNNLLWLFVFVIFCLDWRRSIFLDYFTQLAFSQIYSFYYFSFFLSRKNIKLFRVI
jgi:hypothetical protein